MKILLDYPVVYMKYYQDDQFVDEPPPCRLILSRFKDAMMRDSSTFSVSLDQNIMFGSTPLETAQISGFNSFNVKECSPLMDGIMLIRIRFNQLTLSSPRLGLDS